MFGSGDDTVPPTIGFPCSSFCFAVLYSGAAAGACGPACGSWTVITQIAPLNATRQASRLRSISVSLWLSGHLSRDRNTSHVDCLETLTRVPSAHTVRKTSDRSRAWYRIRPEVF